MVGKSGNASKRVAEVTANARSSRPNVLYQAYDSIKHDLNGPARRSVTRSASAVGHVHHLHADHLFEQFALKVLIGPDAARRHVYLAGIGFDVTQ
jgi:hypothetical protein